MNGFYQDGLCGSCLRQIREGGCLVEVHPSLGSVSCCYCSVVESCPALCDSRTAARRASLSITLSQSLLKLTESVMPSNHLILCHPLLLLPSIFPSIRVFSNESALRNPLPISFSISSSNDYSFILGLISLGINWFDLLAVTLLGLP